ncbi:MAG: Unknown protein, partial [uncultured Aureispira sp.]
MESNGYFVAQNWRLKKIAIAL